MFPITGVCVCVCARLHFSAYVLWKCTVNVCRLYAFLQVCICTVLHYTFKCTCLKSVYTFECACMHVCVLRITQCRLVGETVRIQADYRGEIQSLHHTDPVFYLWKTGGYMSEQDEKVPCCVSYKKVDGQRVQEWEGPAGKKCYYRIQSVGV